MQVPEGRGWSGDAKELKKHEKTCDFVKDPTRRACKNNCGFYGLLDATARHEVNCDYVDPRIAKRLAKESPPKKESKGARRLRLKGLSPESERSGAGAGRGAPISETTTYGPRRRWSHAFAGRHANDRGGTDQIIVISKILSSKLTQLSEKKLQKKLDKAQEAVDNSKQALRDAEACPRRALQGENCSGQSVHRKYLHEKFAEVQKKYNKVHEAKAPRSARSKEVVLRSLTEG